MQDSHILTLGLEHGDPAKKKIYFLKLHGLRCKHPRNTLKYTKREISIINTRLQVILHAGFPYFNPRVRVRNTLKYTKREIWESSKTLKKKNLFFKTSWITMQTS